MAPNPEAFKEKAQVLSGFIGVLPNRLTSRSKARLLPPTPSSSRPMPASRCTEWLAPITRRWRFTAWMTRLELRH